MKREAFLSSLCCLFITSFLMLAGCSKPILKMQKPFPPIVREYEHVTLNGNRPGMLNTGVYLNKGDVYSILARGSINTSPSKPGYHYVTPGSSRFHARIGKNWLFRPMVYSNAAIHRAFYSGELFLGIQDGKLGWYGKPEHPEYYKDNTGTFSVGIVVWESEDYVQIADFFERMKAEHPNEKAIIDALNDANRYKELYLAEAKASKEIEETKKELQELKEEPEKEGGQASPITVEVKKEERVAQLETKLAKLTETLAQLEEMKQKFEEERLKTALLTKELAETEQREKDLLTKLASDAKGPPVIVIASPEDGCEVEAKMIHLAGAAEDDRGLEQLEILVNNRPLEGETGRGIVLQEKAHPKRLVFRKRIPLEAGQNTITVRAVDSDGLVAEKNLTVRKREIGKNVWAVVIGVNDYPHFRKLRYAVDDAKAFYEHLVYYNKIPAENVTLLLDQEAHLTKLRSTLGTRLKNKAGKEDMVILYFAGHGATEKDVLSPDGDGLEKYLLPYNADPQDLYATALPMEEISRIFNRIRAERLVFIADSCYSGASGGRTISLTGVRANISDAFLDRISRGKGRIILTASGANEVSCENDKLKHGIFTYFLLEGLRGKADADQDGVVTVDEAYAYLSKHVPQATGQEQHPVKKGTVEGRLVLSVIN
ncbi:MAG: caspase family protein [Deltaproteobacteria bacterium]|nr:MAG: caspase family protein [Deltaproteobacteria bacterium]